MNKLFTKVVGLCLGLTMAVGVGTAVAFNGVHKEAVEAKAATATMAYSGSSTTNMTGGNDAATVGLDASIFSVIGDKGGNGNYPGLNKAGQIRLYGSASNHNTVTVSCSSDYSISSITATYGSSNYNCLVTVGGSEVTGSGSNTEKTYSFASGTTSFTMKHNYSATTQVYIISVVINYASGSSKTLDHISVGGSMSKTEYTTNDSWDPAGLTVTAYYDDSSSATVTESASWSFSPAAPAEGVTSVVATASYSEKSASSNPQSVTVTKADPRLDISVDSYTATGSYAEVDWSNNNIDGKIYAIKNGDNIQFKASTSYVYNTTAISGYITNITAVVAAGQSYSKLTAFVSGDNPISAMPSSGGVDNSTNWVWNFNESSHYTYFRIDATSSGAKYFSHIYVTYKEVSTVDPTGITLDNSSPISMDTYGYGKRNLTATVEPFNANDKTVTWGTSDSNVVTVIDGVLTAVGAGTATVYGTTCNYVDDVTTPELKASVSVTVTQAPYKKATFVPTSTTTLTSHDDYLVTGSASVTSDGSFNSEKSAIQLTAGKAATFTISGYSEMEISGIDLIMSSNGSAGSGSLTVSIGSTIAYEIETAPFSDPSWNGSYSANAVGLYKAFADSYAVGAGEDVVLSFSASENSLYIHSVAIRYSEAPVPEQHFELGGVMANNELYYDDIGTLTISFKDPSQESLYPIVMASVVELDAPVALDGEDKTYEYLTDDISGASATFTLSVYAYSSDYSSYLNEDIVVTIIKPAALVDAVDYAAAYLNAICDSGEMSSTDWAEAKDAYETILGSDSQAYLLSADYSYESEGGVIVPTAKVGTHSTIAKAMYQYDYCLKKYSYENFMSRTPVYNIGYNANPFFAVSGDNSSIAIIVVVSLLSVTAIGGYFFIRRRKEN